MATNFTTDLTPLSPPEPPAPEPLDPDDDAPPAPEDEPLDVAEELAPLLTELNVAFDVDDSPEHPASVNDIQEVSAKAKLRSRVDMGMHFT